MLFDPGEPAPQAIAAVPVGVTESEEETPLAAARGAAALAMTMRTLADCPAMRMKSPGLCWATKLETDREAGFTALTESESLSVQLLPPDPEQPPLDGVPLTLAVMLLPAVDVGVTVHVSALLSEFAAREKGVGSALLVQPLGTPSVTVTPVQDTPLPLWMMA